MTRRARPVLPHRLSPLSDRQMAWVRPLWFVALALAIVLDIASTVFVVRDFYRNDVRFLEQF